MSRKPIKESTVGFGLSPVIHNVSVDTVEYNYWFRHEEDKTRDDYDPLMIEIFKMMEQYGHIIFILDQFDWYYDRPGVTLKEIIIAKLFFDRKIIANEQFFVYSLEDICRNYPMQTISLVKTFLAYIGEDKDVSVCGTYSNIEITAKLSTLLNYTCSGLLQKED